MTRTGRKRRSGRLRTTAALALAVVVLQPGIAGAQFDEVSRAVGVGRDPNARMLLEADQLIYDTRSDKVTAAGSVEIYYDGYSLFAASVTLDRKTNRLSATGGVRLTEPDGNVVTAQSLDLSDDFRDGFVSSLRVDTIQRTRFAAESARREAGERVTFEKGVYSACASCIEDPTKRPLWQIKAQRIIHEKSEQTIYFDQARLEFLDVPIAYVPWFSAPDPSVKRKSGFLAPTTIYSEQIGFGVAVPYFWALAPNYDLTLITTPLTRQGALVQTEWRQRLMTGAYDIRLAGIFQADQAAFSETDGDRSFRGSAASKGEFWLNQRWKWGWDVAWTTDPTFVGDYDIPLGGEDDAVSTLYLTGLGERNLFDLRGYAFRVFQQDTVLVSDNYIPPAPFSAPGLQQQSKQPIVLPVMDYVGYASAPVGGGELSWTTNITTLTRETTDAIAGRDGTIRYRGAAGTFARFTAETTWQREIIAPGGTVFTPYADLRGDLFAIDSTESAVEPLQGQTLVARGMPSIGLDFRYPWLFAAEWGNQVVTPIAQIVARPNETSIGDLPNEDAQSLVFDDTTLFEWDKFSGFDRVEGGTRANIGVEYAAQLASGGAIAALLGQSYQVAGKNSYSEADILDSTANSGLGSSDSDYVTRLAFDTQRGLRLSTRARFDNVDFDAKRVEIAATGVQGPLTAQVLYAYLGREPGLGITDDRREVQGSASMRLLPEWRVFGTLRYDLEQDDVVADGYGLAFDDESFSASISYAEDRSGATGIPVDRTIFFRFGFRTIGDLDLSTGN